MISRKSNSNLLHMSVKPLGTWTELCNSRVSSDFLRLIIERGGGESNFTPYWTNTAGDMNDPFLGLQTEPTDVVDYIQVIFFKLFGLKWSSYVLHASFFIVFTSIFAHFSYVFIHIL